jgi:hypothetical protein
MSDPRTTPESSSGSAVAPDFSPRPQSSAAELATADLPRVFHRLNNQLGIILANAELLEARLSDETQRTRASLVVAGALEAISTIQELRRLVGDRAGLER